MYPLHRPLYLYVLILIPSATQGADADPRRFFDIDLPAGKSISPETFRGVLPYQILSLGQGSSPADISKLHKLKGGAQPAEKVGSPDIRLRLPGDYAFTQVFYTFSFGQLRKVAFHGGQPIPSRGRVERCYESLVHLLGKPEGVYERTGGRARTVSNTQLLVRWKVDGAAVIFRLRHEYQIPFLFELEYLSPQAMQKLRGRETLSDKLWKRTDQRDAVKAFLDQANVLPPGDASFQVIEPASDEAGRLRQYNLAVGRKGEPIWDIQYKQLAEKLDGLLRADYKARFKTKHEVYAHLLAICEGYQRGFSSGDVQCGAAAYLASFDDPAVDEYLFKGIEIEIPPGIAEYCKQGIARRCKGKVMDRVLEWIDSGNDGLSSHAYYILLDIKSDAQIDELEKKMAGLKSERGRSAAASALLKLRHWERRH